MTGYPVMPCVSRLSAHEVVPSLKGILLQYLGIIDGNSHPSLRKRDLISIRTSWRRRTLATYEGRMSRDWVTYRSHFYHIQGFVTYYYPQVRKSRRGLSSPLSDGWWPGGEKG